MAWATTTDGETVCGTRDAAYLPARVPWEEVESVDWDGESSTMTLIETEAPPRILRLDGEPRRLLQLVRERVSASVVLQRHVAVSGGRGFRVIGRQAPGRRTGLVWLTRYDQGVDPDDPEVRRLATEALAAARADAGVG